jgi:uncharacterized membrane protein
MLIRWLPLIAGIVPFIGVHICYVVAVQHGFLPACIPHVDGCTSISATGRNPPASFLFRAIELPFAAILVVIWHFTVEWLRVLKPALSRRMAVAILVSGVAGALALIVYVTFLGTKEPIYEFMRRFGIYFYFLGTVLAQLFVALSLRSAGNAALGRLPDVMLWLCVSPFALGLLNLAQKAVLAHATADALENSIEWFAATLMQAYFVVLYFAWRRTGFEARVTVDQEPRPG